MTLAPPQRLHHVAYLTRDTQKTVDFYTRCLNMKLVASVQSESVPSTGDEHPHLHTFFQMGSPSDFKSPLAKAKALSPEAVVLIGTGSDVGRVLKQAKQLGIKTAWFGSRRASSSRCWSWPRGAPRASSTWTTPSTRRPAVPP